MRETIKYLCVIVGIVLEFFKNYKAYCFLLFRIFYPYYFALVFIFGSEYFYH